MIYTYILLQNTKQEVYKNERKLLATNNFDPSKFLYKTKQEQEQEEEVLVEGETHTDRQSIQNCVSDTKF